MNSSLVKSQEHKYKYLYSLYINSTLSPLFSNQWIVANLFYITLSKLNILVYNHLLFIDWPMVAFYYIYFVTYSWFVSHINSPCLGFVTGNPQVILPSPAPTPAWNPYLCSWVWVPHMGTHGLHITPSHWHHITNPHHYLPLTTIATGQPQQNNMTWHNKGRGKQQGQGMGHCAHPQQLVHFLKICYCNNN